MATQLLELAERCENADGPSFQLDTDIAYAIGRSLEGLAKPYTASIDAAVSLIPKGRSWGVENPDNADGKRSVFGYPSRCVAWIEGSRSVHYYGATPALAIANAALNIRATPTQVEKGGAE